MSYTLSIKNFRRIREADIAINTVTLVCGKNAAGKSSIAQAATALLINNPKVLNVTKSESKEIIRDGEKTAVASIRDSDDNYITCTWPSMEVHSQGNQISAGVVAAGTERFSQMSDKARAEVIFQVLGAIPTESEFAEALAMTCDNNELREKWASIERRGWDAVYSEYSKSATESKGMWRGVTNEVWGSQKAESWMGQGIAEDELKIGAAEFEKELGKAQEKYEELLKSGAVKDAEYAKITEAASRFDGLVEKKKEYVQIISGLDKDIATIEDELNLLPKAESGHTFPCPHCKGSITSIKTNEGVTVYKKAVEDDESKIKQIRLERAGLEGRLSNLRAKLSAAKSEMAIINQNGKVSQDARVRLADIAATGNERTAKAIVDQQREVVEAIVGKIKAVEATERAAVIHREIMKNMEIADMLSPTGIRKKKLTESLDYFNNKVLAPLCKRFSIEEVRLDSNFNVLLGGRKYKYLSQSYQFRADVVIQVAMARLDNSSMVVIDGSDIILGEDRGGLLNMLFECGRPVLLCMAMNKETGVPDITSAGGNVYWVEEGEVKEMYV